MQVPVRAAGKGLAIRIGCHSDTLRHLDAWERAPEISFVVAVTKSDTVVANAFGGLIYVVVPAKCAAEPTDVTISGAIEAARFVRGETNVTSWREQLRHAPAPWAELATSKVILTVPAHIVQALDDPETLLHFWDQVLDAQAELAAISRERRRAERIVGDVPISAGYMHSGYPIMTHLDAAHRAVTLEARKPDGWEFWHELGHNHQQPE